MVWTLALSITRSSFMRADGEVPRTYPGVAPSVGSHGLITLVYCQTVRLDGQAATCQVPPRRQPRELPVSLAGGPLCVGDVAD